MLRIFLLVALSALPGVRFQSKCMDKAKSVILYECLIEIINESLNCMKDYRLFGLLITSKLSNYIYGINYCVKLQLIYTLCTQYFYIHLIFRNAVKFHIYVT